MLSETNETMISAHGSRLAVIVGVNETRSSLLPLLSHAINDAEAIAQVLHQQCNFELLVPPLLGEEAESAKVKKAILSLARNRNDDDVLLFYFSGHGQQVYDEQRSKIRNAYLGTADFAEQDVEDDSTFHISMHWLRDKLMKNTDAGQVFIILDCCYAEDIRTGSDHSLNELREQLTYYFEIPGAEVGIRRGGLRVALAAAGYDQTAGEQHGHGKMTKVLLEALRGEIARLLEANGQLTLSRTLDYVDQAMTPEQKPVISYSKSAGKECILAHYPDIASQLRQKASQALGAKCPTSYIPFPRNRLFQSRPGEFERLEALLFDSGEQHMPLRLGLIGVIGMGGIGKTQLAVELAYRAQEQKRFPDGVFWMLATGDTLFEWQRLFAELAFHTGYLPPDDDISHQENEARRARHLCHYLAKHKDALLILDNVEAPELMNNVLPVLAGSELACSILYTSRIVNRQPGVTIHTVEALPEIGALRLLLATTRPQLLSAIEAGSMDIEARVAREVCQRVGYLPLALVHLRSLLERDSQVTLVRLAEVLIQRGALDLAKTQHGDASALFATFALSWEKVSNDEARHLFKLACYFPEAAPIPRWLLGVAAGLGEGRDIFEPLGDACIQLQELSLIEVLSEDLLRLHPLVRAFGRQLVTLEEGSEITLLQEASERLMAEFEDLNRLEQRILRESYWGCLEQVRAARNYLEQLMSGQTKRLSRIERWLARESSLFSVSYWWPQLIPGLLYQQLYNRSTEEGHPPIMGKAPAQWLRQVGQVGVEDPSLLRMFVGHFGSVQSAVFSPDGTKVLTRSDDNTARLWETATGRELAILRGEMAKAIFSPDGTKVLTWESYYRNVQLWDTITRRKLVDLQGISGVRSAVFSPDGGMILTASTDRTARLWETATGRELTIMQGHTGAITSVMFSPDGTKILTGSHDGTARLWETTTGRELRILQGHVDSVMSIAFSPDGTKILTGSIDNTARIWKATNGRKLATLQGHLDFIGSVTFSPDGARVLTGSHDGTARLWETTTGHELITMQGHSKAVRKAIFSPDGTRILTSSDDGTARLWDATSGRELVTLPSYSSYVKRIEFSPNGHYVIICNDHQQAFFFQANGKEIGTLRGMYVVMYELGPVYWQDANHVILTDMGVMRTHPHFYRLKLEGVW